MSDIRTELARAGAGSAAYLDASGTDFESLEDYMATLTEQGRADARMYRRGYEGQAAWLAGKPLSFARHCLAQRLASTERSWFNKGADAATRDHIATLEKQSAATS